jgi:uncharacterized protein
VNKVNRQEQALRPAGRPAGFQRWHDLLFLHWDVSAEAVQQSLPAGLEPDLWQGRALLGVVPFTMRDVSPWWSPSVPGISNFHELNLRTYVIKDGIPGVWFYSLDAANALAVLIARLGWKLPYHKATMSLQKEGSSVRYRSRRHWPKPKPVDFFAHYEVGEATGPAQPGTLDHFLVERYILYTSHQQHIFRGQVHHRPYPLSKARLLACEHNLLEAYGFSPESETPLVHYSPGVDVDVYALEKVR